MKVFNLKQGTPEWHAHRKLHRNASDTPVVMALSKFKTRAQFMRELKTGVPMDPGQYTEEVIYAAGHADEAKARPLAEVIFDDDLYPVTGSNGIWSASFDGKPLIGSKAWEHKSLNDELRAAMPIAGMNENVLLPAMYRVQLEHQCMVGELDGELFTASKWNGDKLIEARHCWYTSDPVLREDIVGAWDHFEKELETYEPPEIVVKAVAGAIKQFPVLRIEIKGEVTASNLQAYRDAADEFIGKISLKLKTSEDFANAAANANHCEMAEKQLVLVKAQALTQTQSISELFTTVDHIVAQLAEKRLALTKLVDAEKVAIKERVFIAARKDWVTHFDALEKEIAPFKLANVATPDFATAGKGKRTLETLQTAIDAELLGAKLAADRVARGVRDNLASYKVTAIEHEFLFPDLQALLAKAADDFDAVIQLRIAAHIQVEEDKKAAAALAAAAVVVVAPVVVAAPVEAVAPVAVAVAAPAPAVIQLRPVAVAPAAAVGPPTMSVGKVSTRLGFAVTASFLESIGFPAVSRERGSVLYHENSFAMICAGIVRHIESIQAKEAA